MTDLVPTPRNSAPALPRITPEGQAMSRNLALTLARLTDPDPEMRALRHFDPASIPEHERREASGLLAEFHDQMRPVSRREVVIWLGAINAGCRNPQSEADLKTRINAIAQDVAHLPSAVFSGETRRAMAMHTAFFPAIGDVLAVLEPAAAALRAKGAALELVASSVPEVVEEKAPAPVKEVVDRVANQAKVAAMKADFAEARKIGSGHKPSDWRERYSLTGEERQVGEERKRLLVQKDRQNTLVAQAKRMGARP